jgi:hypothetical protein
MQSSGKYYPADFLSQERAQLKCQLPHFKLDVCVLMGPSTLSKVVRREDFVLDEDLVLL